MADKTATTTMPLSPAQRRHLQRLVTELGRAEDAFRVAEAARDKAQQTANSFVDYCAEELGAQGLWFDQATLSFGPKPPEGGN